MYTINELEAASGVNRRNIHFYVQQGVLPPPSGAGLAARYDDEHLLRLRAIPLLRNRGLRLDEIRDKLADADRKAIEQIVLQPQPLPGELRRAPRASISGRTTIRYTIAEGVELFVDGGVPASTRERVAQLIQQAQQIFTTEKGETR